MRVLMTCDSAYGHLQPLLPLARALKDAGHDVACAIAADLRPRAEAAGLRAFEAGIPLGAAFERLAERFPDQEYNRLTPDEILGWYLPHLFGEVLAPAMLRDLVPLVRDWRPDVVVHESEEYAGPIAAAQAGIPSVCQTLGLRIADPILDSVATAVAPLWRERGLDPDPTAGLYRHLMLDITPPTLQPYALSRHRERIRPLRPVVSPPLPGEQLPSWIEQRGQAPLLHMTLGTNTNTDESMFRAVIEGLRDLDLAVLMTIGFNADPAAYEPLPANVHVEPYVPQALLLPLCTLVICHGGMGTTLASLAQGLPLLILPQGADQYEVAEHIRAAGAGLALTPPEVNATSIRASVLALLHEPAYRASAKRLQSEIAAMPGPAEAVALIEGVVAAGPV